MENVITAGALAAVLIEAIKWVLRTFVYKDPNYDFSPKFYTFLLTVLSYVVTPLSVWLNTGEWYLPSTWQEWLFEFLRVLVTAVLGLVSYLGIKSIKVYSREYNLMKR